MTCMFSVRARGWVEFSCSYCSCFCRNTSEPWFPWGLFQQSRSKWVLPHQWRDSKTHLQHPSTSTWMIINHIQYIYIYTLRNIFIICKSQKCFHIWDLWLSDLRCLRLDLQLPLLFFWFGS